MHDSTFGNTEYTTTKELELIMAYMTSGNPSNQLRLIKSFKSTVLCPNGAQGYYRANSSEVWEYIQKNYPLFINKQRIRSIVELYAAVLEWIMKSKK